MCDLDLGSSKVVRINPPVGSPGVHTVVLVIRRAGWGKDLDWGHNSSVNVLLRVGCFQSWSSKAPRQQTVLPKDLKSKRLPS